MTIDYEHFRARVVQDAINEGLAATWQRRARAFLEARPRPDEFHGQATHDQLRERWQRLTDLAAACEARAAVSLAHQGIDRDVWEALADRDVLHENGSMVA